MDISNQHLRQFRDIIDKYKDQTKCPISNNWEEKNNNELWLWLVGQVIVVGGVAGNERFYQRKDLQKQISYSCLKQYSNDEELQLVINKVLREAGVRYASSEIEKCKKSKALVHNFRFVSNYKKGFKGLINFLNQIEGVNAEQERVAYLVQHFMFIKNKSARDFLMSMGINTNTLALDIRIQNIFKFFGIRFPTQTELSRKAIYDSTENEIIKKICKPLDVAPLVFDRILFQNYKKIIADKTKN